MHALAQSICSFHFFMCQMAQQLKEEQDIRSLEEQLKQNIHEQNIQQLSSLAEVSSLPAISQVQATPISLSQVTDALGDVSHALSPLRAASPQTQQAEHIQRLVEGFQQVCQHTLLSVACYVDTYTA